VTAEMKPTIIYQWPDLRFYLTNALAPADSYLLAEPGDTAKSVLGKLQRGCECFWFHVDCTITTNFPTGRAELLATLSDMDIKVINGHVTDISKRYLHEFNRNHDFTDVSATNIGDPDELIIVKTNYNSLGDTEQYLSAVDLDLLGLNRSESVPAGFQYHVRARSSIDATFWSNPALVCERFIRNQYGIWYRAFIRRPKLALCQFQSPAPIKKDGKSTHLGTMWLRTDDGSAAQSATASLVLRFIEAFRLDFGAVDIVTDLKGVAAIIDVNTTPWVGRRAPEFPYLVNVTSYLRD